MFKNKKSLKESVVNQINSLLKNKELLTIVYIELKNNTNVYEEHCLLFLNSSKKFVYHYWIANKNNDGEIDINSVDFGLKHNIDISNIEKLENQIIIDKASYYLKKMFVKKLEKKLPIKNKSNNKKLKI